MRASICDWDLRAAFKRKEQAVNAIKLILDEPIEYNVEFSTESTATEHLYIVEVHDMPWANNLARVAAILESVEEPSI